MRPLRHCGRSRRAASARSVTRRAPSTREIACRAPATAPAARLAAAGSAGERGLARCRPSRNIKPAAMPAPLTSPGVALMRHLQFLERTERLATRWVGLEARSYALGHER